MKTSIALFVIALVAAARPALADKHDRVTYDVRAGDTLELIAAEYYGDRDDAVFIMLANNITHPQPLKPGMQLQIPVSREITAAPNDTFASLAGLYLADPRRGSFLAEFNGLPADNAPATGSLLSIPFSVNHKASSKEPLSNVATAFLGDASRAKMLREYNFLDHDTLAPGETIVIPIYRVRVRPSKLPPLDANSKARAERRRTTDQNATAALPQAMTAWRSGDYGAVKRALIDIDLDYLDSARAAALGMLLGSAYVAFADSDSAVATFRHVLERRPKQTMDRYRYSPKIREAWQRAGGAIAP